ncbi:hypothetical protein Ancab_038274 [Ancistrocladus abbreviatus]
MRGVGGPLLCIGDLLNDVGEPGEHQQGQIPQSPSSSSSSLHPSFDTNLQPSDLTRLFQENYDELNKALTGADHSWTSLTIKLCTALDSANKLIKSTNTNVVMLSDKLGELERIIKKGDCAVAAARSIHCSLSHKSGSSTGSQHIR